MEWLKNKFIDAYSIPDGRILSLFHAFLRDEDFGKFKAPHYPNVSSALSKAKYGANSTSTIQFAAAYVCIFLRFLVKVLEKP